MIRRPQESSRFPYTSLFRSLGQVERDGRAVQGEGDHHPLRLSVPSFGLSSLRPDAGDADRSEEHTSELQSRQYLVCRLLLDKKYVFNDITWKLNKKYNSCSY